jgi:sugar-specific transcriptional regulator TrmB
VSHERVTKALINLGLTPEDADVYVHLARQGPQKARSIGEALKMKDQHLYRCLRSLRNKEIINVISDTAEISAINFEKALDLLIKAHLMKSQNIEQEKEEILSQWRSIISKLSI